MSVKWYSIPTGEKLRPFTFIVGGRGIGKTYSAIGEGIKNHRGRFMYLRNTREQLAESCGNFGNPFKKYADDNKLDIRLEVERRHAIINQYVYCDDGESQRKINIGVGANLSTFENLRGVDLSNIDYILFDEFIENRTLSFDQFRAFVNMYETVNRNRELIGEEPCKVVLLSNAQRLGNPILRGFNLIPVIESMQKAGQRAYSNGPIRIELPFSDVSEGKRTTALYSAINGTNYADEALNNNFANDSFSGVKKVNINEYTPVVALDDIYIYRHKSDSTFYACGIQAKCKKFTTIDNFVVFYKLYGFKLKLAAADDKLYYSDYQTKCDLLERLKMLY